MSDGGQQQSAGGTVDLSPGVTTVAFDPIVPPLRIPVRAGVDDDYSKGEWLLAFKDEESWTRGWQTCQRKLFEQCEIGARMGCSITAANACRVPWWKQALVFMKVAKIGEEEREACEEREMMGCLARSKESCTNYARDTCDPIFADMRIAESHMTLDPRFTDPPRRRTLSNDTELQRVNSFTGKNPEAPAVNKRRDGGDNEDSISPEPDSGKRTNYSGRQLMDSSSLQRSCDGPAWSEKSVVAETLAETGHPVDGWEGGLISPKLKIQGKQTKDQNPQDV